ncbi:MAG: YqeG family HAD IIIA-type phosphatase [Clostridia bacterium]|nr:YqeG family HAD IIIA-type phosphatase [Clostridia bacterium]
MKYTNAYPKYQFRRITDITVEDLRKMGAKAVAVDLDNTTVIDSSYKLPEETRKWIETVREAGIQVIIISNTWFTRAWYLGKKMGVPFIAPAHKPHTRAIRKAAKMLDVKLENIAMIGDQLFTDIISANKAGAISIRVEPMEKEKLFAGHFKKVRAREREYMKQHRAENKKGKCTA